MAGLAARAGKLPTNGPDCGIGKIISKLDDEDRATLQGWLDDDTIPATVIAAWMTDHGHRSSPHNWRWHRSGRCACDRPG